MSQDTEIQDKKETDFHNHAVKGDLREIGAIPLAHDQEENNPASEQSKKKHGYSEMLHAVLEAQKNLEESLNAQLQALRDILDDLEKDMSANRDEWDIHAEILDQIDDVFRDFTDGGELNQEIAKAIILKAGLETPDGLTDAQMIEMLNTIRQNSLTRIKELDIDYGTLESDHVKFKAREEVLISAKQRLEAIGNDATMSDAQKLTAIQTLGQEVGTNTLHRTATASQSQEASAKADQVFAESRNDAQMNDDVDFSKISVQGLNF